jgi:hypothetical protein
MHHSETKGLREYHPPDAAGMKITTYGVRVERLFKIPFKTRT